MRTITCAMLVVASSTIANPALGSVQSDIRDSPAPLSARQAARFLDQATFGPTTESIHQLLALGSLRAWLRDQVSEGATLQLPATQALAVKMCNTGGAVRVERVNAWWETVTQAPDQLRQRVAFALSEVFVVSDAGGLRPKQYGLASYYDVLLRNAFGNYRELLEEVTLHPVMGRYLDMVRNELADPSNNRFPDENFARELLQLFSIGVHELNPDGTLRLMGGEPVPTYDQAVIKAFARAFTGWNYAGVSWNDWGGNGDMTQAMVPWEEYHDTRPKLLLGGVRLPSGQDTRQDLGGALDNVFQHHNVGPFLSKLLIQRLTTSNPTPDYVRRVAEIFDDNGLGVRGDLEALVRAILLDPEARGGVSRVAHFGKLREPLLRLSHLRRAFHVVPVTKEGAIWSGEDCGQGPYQLYHWTPYDVGSRFGQDILGALSVFNFFQPDYAPPGVVSESGLVAPEFQIADENTITGVANALAFEIQLSDESTLWTTLSTVYEETLADRPGELLEHLDLVLLGGRMSPSLRQILLAHLESGTFPSGPEGPRAKARDTIMLIVLSPEYLIQS